jgi:hypothetical protein
MTDALASYGRSLLLQLKDIFLARSSPTCTLRIVWRCRRNNAMQMMRIASRFSNSQYVVLGLPFRIGAREGNETKRKTSPDTWDDSSTA